MGQAITISRYSSSSIFLGDSLKKKITGEIQSRAADLLQQFGGISLAMAKSDRTKYHQSITVKGEVIRAGPVLKKTKQ